MRIQGLVLTLVWGLLSAPLPAEAQPAGKVHRVEAQLREAKEAGASLGVTLVVVEVRGADYRSAFAKMVSERAQALFVFSSPNLHRDRRRIIELAARHRLPAIYQWREHAEEGGLMAYGSNLSGLSRRMAAYVDRIKGARPADLAVEQPTLYELTVNLKTANARPDDSAIGAGARGSRDPVVTPLRRRLNRCRGVVA